MTFRWEQFCAQPASMEVIAGAPDQPVTVLMSVTVALTSTHPHPTASYDLAGDVRASTTLRNSASNIFVRAFEAMYRQPLAVCANVLLVLSTSPLCDWLLSKVFLSLTSHSPRLPPLPPPGQVHRPTVRHRECMECRAPHHAAAEGVGQSRSERSVWVPGGEW
jgi:hypothetical protein